MCFISFSEGKSKTGMTLVSPTMKVSTVAPLLGPYIKFYLQPEEPEPSSSAENRPTVSTVLLMMGAREQAALPPDFSVQFHPAKHRLKNSIIQWLRKNSLGWSNCSVPSLGLQFVQTLGEAMWYIDGNHETLAKRGCAVPISLQQFSGYRQPEKQKKRKIDENCLRRDGVKAQAQALFNLALASYMKKDGWRSIYAAILGLAKSLQQYDVYLQSHAKHVSTVVSTLMEPM